jgi:hypothetical protein
MTTKKYFVMLSLLIPRSVIEANFDMYLASLVEELSLLFCEGVMMCDAAAWNGQASFILRAMVIWTIHDLPAYGVVTGYTTKGYRGCPVCGLNTQSRRSRALHKNVYEHFRVFLPADHEIREDEVNYGSVEHGVAPP